MPSQPAPLSLTSNLDNNTRNPRTETTKPKLTGHTKIIDYWTTVVQRKEKGNKDSKEEEGKEEGMNIDIDIEIDTGNGKDLDKDGFEEERSR